MSNLTIRASIYQDERFKLLEAKLGLLLARGVCVHAWELAKKYYPLNPNHCIPIRIWNEELTKYPILWDLLAVDLAIKTDAGIYVRGSNKIFAIREFRQKLGKYGSDKKAQLLVLKSLKKMSSKSLEPLPSEKTKNKLLLNKKSNDFNPPIWNRKAIQSEPSQSGINPLIELWNTHCGTLPKPRSSSGLRNRKTRLLLKQHPDLQYWTDVIKKIAASPFCCGSNGWKADFDWLLKEDTHLKVMEGKYDTDHQRSSKPLLKSEQISAYNQAMFEAIKRGEI